MTKSDQIKLIANCRAKWTVIDDATVLRATDEKTKVSIPLTDRVRVLLEVIDASDKATSLRYAAARTLERLP